MRRMSACRQLLIGTSMSRYLPPIGTAGLERAAVSGNSLEPWPPPRMMASVSVSIATHCLAKNLPGAMGFRAVPGVRSGARRVLRPVSTPLRAKPACSLFDLPDRGRAADLVRHEQQRLAGWTL